MGFASSVSIPDVMYVIHGVARGLFEMKNNTSTPAEATRQAISEAFNLAIAQLNKKCEIFRYNDTNCWFEWLFNGVFLHDPAQAFFPSGC
jgi:hypothetical protein